jgi:DNA-binding CsgD family transcriptional regulator
VLKVDHAAILDLLEASYGGDEDEEAWILRVLCATITMAGSRSGAFFRFSSAYEGGHLRLHRAGDMRMVGPDPLWTGASLDVLVNAPRTEVAFGRTHAATFSQDSGLGASLPTVPGFRDCWKEPVVDSLGLVSRDTHGDGFVACVGLDETQSASAREARFLMRLATHLGASDRLRAVERRKRLGEADVVFSPEGRVLHAARDEDVRADPVHDGLERRDFVRRNRHDVEKALEVWQGLVAGRWSIVDHFDTDGKRFVLAMKNAPQVDARGRLPPQERRVAALAAMGHRDKEIAYMLGITPGAVTGALRRARAALNVKTRAELAAAWRRGTTEKGTG